MSVVENPQNPPSKKIRVCFGLPQYGGISQTNFFVCLINTMNLLAQHGIESNPLFILGESLITRARNNIVAKFLNDPNATHLMFIDGDIAWNPMDVIKLIKHNKDLVGGIYPMKTYKWEKLDELENIIERHKSDLHKDIPLADFIRQNLMKYNLNFKYANFKVENNLVEVKHIATGFMMIKRETIEKMILQHPEWKFWDDMGCLNKDEDRFAYTLFQCETIEGHYYSEDWLFCHRWTGMGGQVFADISINLSHSGLHAFQGRFLSTLNISPVASNIPPLAIESNVSSDTVVNDQKSDVETVAKSVEKVQLTEPELV